MKNYSVLLIALDCHYSHIERFVRNLKTENSGISIILYTQNNETDIPDGVKDNVSEIIRRIRPKKHYPNIIYAIVNIYMFISQFAKMSNHRHFDIVNIHFAQYYCVLIARYLKRMSKNIVITPWGSDVYRISKSKLNILKHLYGKANYVICSRFGNLYDDISELMNIPSNRIVDISFGSDSIDYISSHIKAMTSEEAKKALNFGGKYAITCGYNAFPAQRHKEMISAIAQVRNQLPENLVLLFPVTYGFPDRKIYIDELKDCCKQNGLQAIFYEQFLDLSELFVLRQSTDMFIHIQTTDLMNSSIREYILLGKKVLHGTWITYPDFESCTKKPFFAVNDLSELSSVIAESYKSEPIVQSEMLLKDIRSCGWIPQRKKWNEFFESIV